MVRHASTLLLAVSASFLPWSCAAPAPSPQATERRNDAIELAGRLQDIADVAATAFANEVVELRLAGSDDLRTFAAESVRNNAVAYVRSMVLDDDPATALVDLYVFAQLGLWACENRNRLYADLFAENCDETYGAVLERTRHLAEQWMTAEQRQRIDDAVARFKLAHPDRTRIGIVRLPELARTAGTTTASLRTASPTLFSPVTEAAEQLEQTRLLGDRLLWLLSRLPEAIGWRAQAVVMEVFASDVVARLFASVASLDTRLEAVHGGLEGTRASVDTLAASADSMTEGLSGLAETSDRLATSLAAIAPVAESLDRTTDGLASMSRELDRFEAHAADVRSALTSFGDTGEALSTTLTDLSSRIGSLDESVSELQARLAHLESLEVEVVDRMIWKVAALAAGVVLLAGPVVVVALRLGRR